MVQRILVPTDGSIGARRGVENSLEMAEELGASIHTIYVVDETRSGHTPALSSLELVLETEDQRGEVILEEVERLAAERGIDAHCHCVRGEPHEAILDCIESNDIDLVVIGRHGMDGEKPTQSHSIIKRVMDRSSVPVIPV